MGSKRIGFKRMEAILENLKRELALGASAGLKMGGDGYIVPCYPNAAVEDLSGAGAVSVACYHTRYTSTGGGEALTLADGTVLGQMKKITHVVDGGAGNLTITSPVSSDLDVIAFADVGDEAELMWNGSAWRVVSLRNVASGDAGPGIS